MAATVALVELLLLLVIGGGALARTVSHRVERAATGRALSTTGSRAPARPATSRHAPVPTAKLARSKTKVLVLNGNGRTGAAAAGATRLRRHGYEIGGVANARRSNFAHDIVMFRPGFVGEGHRLAKDLGLRLVGPLDGIRVRDLHGAQLVLILGR